MNRLLSIVLACALVAACNSTAITGKGGSNSGNTMRTTIGVSF